MVSDYRYSVITSNGFLNAHREQREGTVTVSAVRIDHMKITSKLSLSVDYVVRSSLITEEE